MMNRWPYYLGMGAFMLVLFSGAHAQTLGADPLTITVSPLNPAPYETITITPESTLTDLSAGTVTISVNGTVVAKGSGGAGASVAAGAAGEKMTIDVTATTPDGTFTKEVIVVPESVALVEEPLSTTHPFYGGGALLAPEGRVRLIALAGFSAGGKSVAPSSLIYTWKLGDQLLEGYSGIGKSVLDATAPLQYRDATVSVTVSTADGSLAGSASIDLSPVDPVLVIYKDGPLLGPQFDEAAVNPYTMSDSEESFRAVPYFFGATPALVWAVNGTANGTEPVVTVRATGASAGSATLSATAGAAGTYQTASDSRTIRYGASTAGGSIFGL